MCMNHQTLTTFNEDRANAFAERLVNALNDAALCLMTSVGHRNCRRAPARTSPITPG
jgi:hypothetical protein